MTQTISATNARNNFGDIMNQVIYQDATFVIEKYGEPQIKLVPLSRGHKKRSKNYLQFAGTLHEKDALDLRKKIKAHRTSFQFTRNK